MAKRHKKRHKSGIRTFILGILLVGLIVGGCAYLYNEFKNRQNDESNTKEEQKKEEPKKVQVINLDSNTRPYAVMINNNSAVWKYQSGLNEAYIVYEMVVEGGITREMALFKDTDTKKIASVRSSRHYFLDYALENDAIYVHWGWSPQAQSDIKSLKINNINGLTYEGTYFFRDKTITGVGSEHKGYTTMDSLKKATEKLKYRTTTETTPLLKYSIDPLDLTTNEEVIDAKYVGATFSSGYTAKFYYDENTKMYMKTQNKTEMIDYTSKERITTKNIILYDVSYSTIDSYGRQSIKNIGEGTGYFITEGKAIPINWKKTSRSGKTKYTYKDGSELVVNDGRTYIGLLPKGKSPKFAADLPN